MISDLLRSTLWFQVSLVYQSFRDVLGAVSVITLWN